jgi:hypothetical protein
VSSCECLFLLSVLFLFFFFWIVRRGRPVFNLSSRQWSPPYSIQAVIDFPAVAVTASSNFREGPKMDYRPAVFSQAECSRFSLRFVTTLRGTPKDVREAIKHQLNLGQLHCSAAVSLVQQLAANTLAALPCSNLPQLHERTGTQPHSNFPSCTCPPPFPSIASFFAFVSLSPVFASQSSALPRASLRLIPFLCLLLFVLSPWPLGYGKLHCNDFFLGGVTCFSEA